MKEVERGRGYWLWDEATWARMSCACVCVCAIAQDEGTAVAPIRLQSRVNWANERLTASCRWRYCLRYWWRHHVVFYSQCQKYNKTRNVIIYTRHCSFYRGYFPPGSVTLRKRRFLTTLSTWHQISRTHVANNMNRFPITKKILLHVLPSLAKKKKQKRKKEIKSKKVQLHGRQLLVYFTATARWFILSLSLSTLPPFFRFSSPCFSFLLHRRANSCCLGLCLVCDFSMLHFSCSRHPAT